MPKLKVDLVVDDKGSLVITGFGNKVDRVMWSSRGAVKSFAKELSVAGAGLTAVAASGGFLLKHLVDISDRYALLESRLKLVTNGTSELNSVQEQLYQVNKRTYGQYETTVGLYTQMARSTKNLNYNQRDLLTVTESIGKSLKISGASVASSNGAIQQLIQGLQSGVLRGQEFNSIMEQTPRIAQMLSDGLGVTTGELRKMANAGKLTTEVVMTAMLSQTDNVNQEFVQMQVNVKQSLTVLKSVFESIVNDGSKSASITEDLSGAIMEFAGYLEENRDAIVNFFHDGLEAGKNFGEWMADFGTDAKPYLAGIATALSSIYDATKKFEEVGGPSDAEWGVIGYTLFRHGIKGGAIVGTLITINSLLGEIAESKFFGLEMDMTWGGMAESYKEQVTAWQNIMNVISGKRDWNTGEWIDQSAAKMTGLKKEIESTRIELDRYENLTGFRRWFNDLLGGQESVDYLRNKLKGLRDELAGLEGEFDAPVVSLPYGSEEEIANLENTNFQLKGLRDNLDSLGSDFDASVVSLPFGSEEEIVNLEQGKTLLTGIDAILEEIAEGSIEEVTDKVARANEVFDALTNKLVANDAALKSWLAQVNKATKEKNEAENEMFEEAGLGAEEYYANQALDLVEKVAKWQKAGADVYESEEWLYDQLGKLSKEAWAAGEMASGQAMDSMQAQARTLVEEFWNTTTNAQKWLAEMGYEVDELDGSTIGITATMDGSGISSEIDILIERFQALQAAATVSVSTRPTPASPQGGVQSDPQSSGSATAQGNRYYFNQQQSRSDITNVIREAERLKGRS